MNYFFFKNSSTNSGATIVSTKVYAPVFGDFTILMAFDNLLEAVCNDATVFFAMIQMLFEINTIYRLYLIANYYLISL